MYAYFYLNYEIFQSILEEYDIDPNDDKMLLYPKYFTDYINSHTLSIL